MSHWSRLHERGSPLGIRIVAACYRLIGERAARLLLYPVVGYFLITGRGARRASREYFARLQRFAGENAGTPPPGWATSFRHMMAFAESALHKLAAWTGRGKALNVAFPDRPRFDALIASGKGALLVGAHLGNLEMARAIAAEWRLATVNAIVYTEHAPAFRHALEASGAEFAANLIHVTQIGPDTILLLKDKIDRGELLVLVGDRTPPADSARVCSVDFLGAPAAFAQGPYVLASLLECPVYLLFCLKEGDGYRIYLEPFAERIVLPRQEREAALRGYAQRYARRLEELCLRSPYQWFNFYNYWQQP